ncbi:hypothetical protein SYNPS1DRAFT_32444 [Syncephalis pseudoplumigaleata]|uniref:Cysteine proteinase n=1 Tax=Syncephalis pseudoplumigaleata TaxID=1712513 RepID=A0A4V1J265_9FUNG|nr:hypothetical protein SYNPS1DRAFT_32444 [Syncephalis pseudoplumigaleata]|eukprot:RKP27479.1 hypothetical protein SYNPS1DRAFT_32444 [Syncephalis pseudoplumigaleata]
MSDVKRRKVADGSVARVGDLYLDTINRHMLDFDFEKVCSVSLSNLNVYACLICGKYYQGRGKNTHAYFHSINEDHHVYINLQTLKVYVLPEGYEVDDSSLDDIKYVIRPTFTKKQVAQLDKEAAFRYDLNNKKYIPGFVGLNNIKANDYVNVIVQALAHVRPLRDYLLLEPVDHQSPLVFQLAMLVRKMWSSQAFKGQVSPHELLQAISNASEKRFRLSTQTDPIELFSWLMNRLHMDLGGTRKKPSSSLAIISQTFQGQLQMTSRRTTAPKQAVDDDRIVEDPNADVTTKQLPFYFLSLDLPPPPLFLDEIEKNIIPQVSLISLLHKYDGVAEQEDKGYAKQYVITRLPRYIVLHVRRFTRNNWSAEKNHTIVNFPIGNLDLNPYKPPTLGAHYNLLANVSHDGEPGNGHYRVHVRRSATNQWYQIEDLNVEEIQTQMIFLSESYIQIWERHTKEQA